MKDSESRYLDRLFSSSSDVTGEAEVDIPLVAVPDDLGGKLVAIAESAPAARVYELDAKRGLSMSWSKVTGIAASLLVAIMGFQFYQQQQTLKQLERAQSDLATALHYLGEANRITRAEVLNSLNANMNKAGVLPAIEIERDTFTPNFKSHELESSPEINRRNRTL